MRVAIATVQVPFIYGGADAMRQGLVQSLKARGIKVEQITRPFRFRPASQVLRTMDEWEAEDADAFDCGHIDRVISLGFPAFYLKHHNNIVWLMHQHRSVYELFGTPFGDDPNNPEMVRLKEEIARRDTNALNNAKHVFTISQRVSARLKHFNGIDSTPLYQPPAHADRYYCSEQRPYVFVPSRLEKVKRQDLLLQAISMTRSPIVAIVAGEGGQHKELERLVDRLGIRYKVRFLGRIGQNEMFAWYANALAVFFGPHDEDYGYITLEGMLSSKPILTCSDSGGPLEFVAHGETGIVSKPDANEIAQHLDWLYAHGASASEMGLAGRARYESMGISWDRVIKELLA